MCIRASLFGEGFPDHVAANDGQQAKGDPVVDKGDLLPELGPHKVADQGHQRLKAAEPQPHQGHLPRIYLPQSLSLIHS